MRLGVYQKPLLRRGEETPSQEDGCQRPQLWNQNSLAAGGLLCTFPLKSKTQEHWRSSGIGGHFWQRLDSPVTHALDYHLFSTAQ